MTTPPARRPPDAIRKADAIAEILDSVRRFAYPLHRALIDSQPGYPTSTMGGGGHGGDISDPTGRYALEGDTSRKDLENWYAYLDGALEHLMGAWSISTKHMAAMSTQKRCRWKEGCPLHRLAEPGYDGFCQPCYRRDRRAASDQAAA